MLERRRSVPYSVGQSSIRATRRSTGIVETSASYSRCGRPRNGDAALGVQADELDLVAEVTVEGGPRGAGRSRRFRPGRGKRKVLLGPQPTSSRPSRISQRTPMVDDADALGDPARRHRRRGRRPDLRVVREHEAARDALAERLLHPRPEWVLGAVRAGRFDQPEKTVVGVLGVEVAQVVLERIRHPAAGEHERRALVLVHVVAEGLVEQAVELAEVAEDDVAALVPREPGGVDEGRRTTTRVVAPSKSAQPSWPSRAARGRTRYRRGRRRR